MVSYGFKELTPGTDDRTLSCPLWKTVFVAPFGSKGDGLFMFVWLIIVN